MNPVDRFIVGFVSPFQGLHLVFSSKKKFALSIIPFLLGIFVLFSGFYWAFNNLGGSVDNWLKQFEFLSGFLFTLASVFVAIFSWIAFFTFAFLMSYVAIILFGGPFYSMLAEEVFKTHSIGGLKSSTMRLILTMILTSIFKVFLFAILGIFCFILSFIPIVNLFSTYIVFLIIAFDCTDFAFEIDYLSLRQRFGFVTRHFWEYSGLTLAILCTTFIPGSFFLLLPAFICGATKMYIQLAGKSL